MIYLDICIVINLIHLLYDIIIFILEVFCMLNNFALPQSYQSLYCLLFYYYIITVYNLLVNFKFILKI